MIGDWEIIALVQKITNWELAKTIKWMGEENPFLGGSSPIDVLKKFGKEELSDIINKGSKYSDSKKRRP